MCRKRNDSVRRGLARPTVRLTRTSPWKIYMSHIARATELVACQDAMHYPTAARPQQSHSPAVSRNGNVSCAMRDLSFIEGMETPCALLIISWRAMRGSVLARTQQRMENAYYRHLLTGCRRRYTPSARNHSRCLTRELYSHARPMKRNARAFASCMNCCSADSRRLACRARREIFHVRRGVRR